MNEPGRLLFAEVALPLPMPRCFHYAIPGHLEAAAVPGARVRVPFGRRTLTGIIVACGPTSPVEKTRQILCIIDPLPAVTTEMLTLARSISRDHLCSIGEALALIVPDSIPPAPAFPALEPVLPPYTGLHLTEEQQAAASAVRAALIERRHQTFLLHGITGSGKTEVYLSLIHEALDHGHSAIFLVPEIALTPHFIGRCTTRFGHTAALWHSRMSRAEKARIWHRARSGSVRVVLGARSAVFAPVRSPGLIILDEEHETSYKQEQRPCYHARDIARERGRISGFPVLLGSATPSLESHTRALSGIYDRLTLTRRIDGRPLPPVRIVLPSRARRQSVLAPESQAALEKVLARGEQAILFLNRRGYAPGITCRSCGNAWNCPHCSISMVYHRDPEQLQCHYCGLVSGWPGSCPTCGSGDASVFGMGTQRVESEVGRLFPSARILRLDRDSAARAGSHQRIYQQFSDRGADILIGTQMVAKGFDFPHVTLVIVIDADTALHVPDFRAGERTFQLLTQVAGRTGRGELPGAVIIQSRFPEHYAIASAARHDYAAFAVQELSFRRQFAYPPHKALGNIILRGPTELRVSDSAHEIAAVVRAAVPDAVVLGPAPAARSKLSGLYRWQILVKSTDDGLHAAAQAAAGHDLSSGVLLSVDLDPQDTL